MLRSDIRGSTAIKDSRIQDLLGFVFSLIMQSLHSVAQRALEALAHFALLLPLLWTRTAL